MGLQRNKCEEKVIYTLLPMICGTQQFPLRNDLRFLSQYPQESVNMITFEIIIKDNEGRIQLYDFLMKPQDTRPITVGKQS